MKSLRFHSRKTAAYFYMALLVTAISCSEKETDVIPDNGDIVPPPVTSISKTIGTSGGTIALDSMAIYVAEGAFSNNIVLELAVEKNPASHPQPAVTSVYKLKGLPDDFTAPIRLSLKYNGTLDGDSYIAHGYYQATMLTDTTALGYDLIDCQDSSGYLTGYLMPPSNDNSSGRRKAQAFSNNDLQDIIDTFNGVDSYEPESYKTDRFDYWLTYPRTLDPAFITEIGCRIDGIHEIFYNLGFQDESFKGFVINRSLEIHDCRGSKNSIQETNRVGRVGRKLHFDYYHSSTDEELRRKMGAAFFDRFIYYLRIEKNCGTTHKPFERSVNSWLEEKWNEANNPSNYIPTHFSESDFRFNFDLFDSRAHNNCEVIKYLATTYGYEFIRDYYKEIVEKNYWFEALKKSIDDPVNIWAPAFFKSLFNREIYPFPESQFGDRIFDNHEITIPVDLSSPDKKIINVPRQYKDLSAKVYYIDLKDAAINEKSKLSFDVTSESVDSKNITCLLYQVYWNNGVMNFIDQGTHLEIPYPLTYKNNNSDLFIVVVNSQSTNIDENRNSSLSKIQLVITLKEALPYRFIFIDLDSVQATRLHNDGRTFINENAHYTFHFPNPLQYEGGSFDNDNDFTAKWDYPDGTRKKWGEVKATVDPETFLLKNFDFKEGIKQYDSNGKLTGERRWHITGVSVRLQEVDLNLGKVIHGNDLNNHVTVFEHILEIKDPVQNQKQGYREEIDFTEHSNMFINFY